jgi:hypothetical protein
MRMIPTFVEIYGIYGNNRERNESMKKRRKKEED